MPVAFLLSVAGYRSRRFRLSIQRQRPGALSTPAKKGAQLVTTTTRNSSSGSASPAAFALSTQAARVAKLTDALLVLLPGRRLQCARAGGVSALTQCGERARHLAVGPQLAQRNSVVPVQMWSDTWQG